MVPEFPNFTYLSDDLVPEIMRFTASLPSYSDFNAASMLAWDVHGKMRVSQLFGNLVVIFSDYITGEEFLSFFGTEDPKKTAEILLDYADTSSLPIELRLIPEEAIRRLPINRSLVALSDRDNYDYVICVDKICSLEGSQFKNLRWQYNAFTTAFGKRASFKELDLNNKADVATIERVFLARESMHEESDDEHEIYALRRLIQYNDCFSLHARVVEIDGTAQAFFIYETVQDYAVGHFWKANTNFRGIYPYLFRSTCRELQVTGHTLINMEQDLGIEQLRAAKGMMRGSFLKKYSIKQLSTARRTVRQPHLQSLNLRLQLV